MDCPKCSNDPCTCRTNPVSNPNAWIIQECTTSGCRVVIRSRAGHQDAIPVCKWCLTNTAYYAKDRG